MNTSKNKIDLLFSEKLEKYEVKPRQQAWEKLEAQLNKKQKRVVPLWQKLSMAASIVLLLFAGWFGFYNNLNNQDKNINNAVNSQQKIASPTNNSLAINKNTKEVLPKIPQNKEANLVVEKQQKKISTKQSPIINEQVKQQFLAKNDPNPETLNGQNIPLDDPNKTLMPLENNNLALIEEPKVEKPETSKADDLTIVLTVANFQKDLPKTIDNTIENSKKPKYFSRLFRQIINAKNGDKVEWDKVGFKPSKILARAENKLKLTKEDISGSYQNIKSKTVL